MKLTSKERQILAVAQFRADSSIKEIAKLCGYREHTVRNGIKRLQQRGMIVKRSMINVRLLGLTRFAVFFSIAKESKKIKQAFFRSLISNDRVAWVREFGGEFPYVFDVVVSNIDEVMKLLEELTQRFGNIFFEKSLAVRYRIIYLERGYLDVKRNEGLLLEEPPLKEGQTYASIDELDHKILSTVSSDPDLPDIHIARILKIPRTTLVYRLEQLREKAILLPSFFDLNPRVVGIFAYRLLIRTRGSLALTGTRLLEYFQSRKHFVSLIMCMGAWDFETTIEVEDPRSATDLVTDIYEQFAETISEIKLLPVFEEPKDIMYPFKKWPIK